MSTTQKEVKCESCGKEIKYGKTMWKGKPFCHCWCALDFAERSSLTEGGLS